MLPLTFLLCWFFYDRLKGVDSQSNYEGMWACIYGFTIFITLLFHPSIQTFFYLGQPTLTSPDLVANNISTYIDLGFSGILLICGILSILFYYTVRLPGFMAGNRFMGLLIAVPGAFINGIVASIIIHLLL